MVSITTLALLSLLWVGLLFAVAWWGEQRVELLARWRPWLYTLSLGVYCTSWAFYGTVGQAAATGWFVPPTYVGTILLLVFGVRMLRKLYDLTRHHNITSIADWVSARYGKSSGLAAAVTVIALFGITPYIALQLKAVAIGFELTTGIDHLQQRELPVFNDGTFYIAIALAAFAILFGTRKVDATEHQHGLVVAMAFESVLKLLALWVVAIGICFFISERPSELFALRLDNVKAMGDELFLTLAGLGALAMFCLPRQFHVGFVECMDRRHIATASWAFPLYLLAMSIFILPVARAGLAAFGVDGVDADTYMLALPASSDYGWLTIVAFLGGLSAATSMVIMASVALSIMLSNDVLIPIALRRGWLAHRGPVVTRTVLVLRRLTIAGLFLLAYGYYRYIGEAEALASIGALAFAAVAQFGPAIIGGMYWRRANRRGVYAGLSIGFGLWAWTLMLPNLVEAGWFSSQLLERGLFDMAWTRPTALLGLGGLNPLAHGALISLLLNSIGFVVVSLATGVTPAERRQAAQFVDPHGLTEQALSGETTDWSGKASLMDVEALIEEFFDQERVALFRRQFPQVLRQPAAAADNAVLAYAERQLAAVVGASSARLLLDAGLRGRSVAPETMAAIVGEASQAVRFSQQLLSAALENIDQGVSVVDADLQLVAWNQRYLELLEYPHGFVEVGRPVAELIRYNAERGMCGPGPVSAHVEKRLAHLRNGSAYVYERQHRDGRVLELRGNPMPDGGFVTSFSDITEYRRAEQALREANETLEDRVQQRTAELNAAKIEAERANNAKSRFLAAISHDVFQPLNAAHLFTHTLSHQLNTPQHLATVQHIYSSLQSVESLLGGLLDMSKLEAGGLQPVVESFALAELLDGLTLEYVAMAREKGLTLTQIPTRLWVSSDRQLLRRIVQNFLANAVRYTEQGRIVLGCRRRGERVCIQVVDTGPGIPLREQEHIFEEFRQLKDNRHGGEGLGLGLAIVKGIAGLLDYPVEIRSTAGAGALFGIEVPITNPMASELQPGLPEHNQVHLRVLCIEDDTAVLKALTGLLASWGCSTTAARSWHQGIAMAGDYQPHLILADYHLDQNRTGLDLIGVIRTKLQREVPAAIVTADYSEAVREAVRAAGIYYLNKPVRPMALRALLERIERSQRSAD